MNKRILQYIAIAFLALLIIGVVVNVVLLQQSIPTLKPELITKNQGIISVVNDKPYLVNNTKLYSIDNLQLKLLKEFANDSQVELNPFGTFVTEKRPNIKTIYNVSNLQSIQQANGRFFAWLSKDSYLLTNSTNQTEGTDAGDLTETAYKATVTSSQKTQLFTGSFMTYMLLADDKYIDLAQRDNQENYDNITINQFTQKDGLQNITSKHNFGYKPFLPLGFSLIQENTSAKPVYLIKDKTITQLKLTSVDIQTVTAVNNKSIIYFSRDNEKNTTYLYLFDIETQTSKPIAKLPVDFQNISNLASSSQYIYLNSKDGIYRMSTEGLQW